MPLINLFQTKYNADTLLKIYLQSIYLQDKHLIAGCV